MTGHVHIYPMFGGEDQGDGGVRRVIEAQLAHLPAHGWEHEPSPAEADVIACHITVPDSYVRLYPQKPLVAHCHGLYWAEYEWQAWALKANAEVMELLRVADVITAPSEWVATVLRRHTSRRVEVVHHGIDVAEWQPGPNKGYVLWNKTRPDPVCDPAAMNAVARLLPSVCFASTYGDGHRLEAALLDGNLPTVMERFVQLLGAEPSARDNVLITGRLPFPLARELIRHAGVYLATAKETFGIGTLEALASGVPVVGFAHGGQPEIVSHGVDGWLVPPDDHEGLARGIEWALANRDRLAPACREKAARFPWPAAAARYAEIYAEAAERGRLWSLPVGQRPPKVSVIVTAYGLELYLPDCLDSVRAQTLEDWECIVVDDASPDRCGEIAEGYASRDPRFRVIHNSENRYLAEARNIGIAAARGAYIKPLDADDLLPARALELEAAALDADRKTHIAYGSVLFVNEDGLTPTDYGVPSHTPGHSGWPLPFSVEHQARGFNLLPYSSMYRRSVWESVGGYHRHCRTAEDADFWVRAASYGFRPRMVTTADTLIYRNREGSMSRAVGARQWIRWFPWGADPALMPAAAATERQLPVPAFDPPGVAVIVPVGPGHERIVQEAVDSVEAQSYRNWECIVVNDSGGELAPLPSWVRVVTTPGRTGVAHARNLGIAAARAELFLPLDADDLLQPDALQWLLTAHVWSSGEIIYCDFWQDPEEPSRWNIYNTPDYDPMLLVRRGAIHPVTALTPKHVWRELGGYDEGLPCWEDWAFAMAAAERGFCSRRIAAPLFTYRKWTGSRREDNQLGFPDCEREMKRRFPWFEWGEGGKSMAGCGCSAKGSFIPPTGLKISRNGPPGDGALQVQYTGIREGSMPFRGRSGTRYRFDAREPVKWVLAPDLDMFRRRPDFVVLDASGPAAEPDVPDLISEGPAPGSPGDFVLPSALPAVFTAAQGFSGGSIIPIPGAGSPPAATMAVAATAPADVEPEALVAALRGLGLSEDEARRRVAERLGSAVETA